MLHAQHIRLPALVPLGFAHCVQIVEVGEPSPAVVADDDVETTESLRGLLYAVGYFGHDPAVGLQDDCLHAMLALQLFGELLRRSL